MGRALGKIGEVGERIKRYKLLDINKLQDIIYSIKKTVSNTNNFVWWQIVTGLVKVIIL